MKKWIGKYEILGEIGRGGMSKVFLALQHGPMGYTRRVVIKTMLDESRNLRRMINEAKALSFLNHNNVISVIDFLEIDERLYMVTEFISGLSFSKFRKNFGKVPQDIILGLVTQVLMGLENVHSFRHPEMGDLGLVHRDISAGNIMINLDGTVKLIDFGVVRGSNLSSGTRVGKVVGKVKYLAPEIIKGKPMNHLSDIFAVGVVLYESLTFHRIHPNQKDQDVFGRLTDGTYFEELKLKGFSPGLQGILKKALNPDIKKRYQNAKDFLYDLYEYRKANHQMDDFQVKRWLKEKLSPVVMEEESKELIPPSGTKIKPRRSFLRNLFGYRQKMAAVVIFAVAGFFFLVSSLTVRKVKVFIESDPEGAMVYIDGHLSPKRTPIELVFEQVEEAKIKFLIRKKYYHDFERNIDLSQADGLKISANLRSKATRIFFWRMPEGTKISVNGESLEKGKRVFEDAKLGKKYDIDFDFPGGLSKKYTVKPESPDEIHIDKSQL